MYFVKKRRFDDVSKNKIKEIIAYSARTVALMFASGAMIQTFLASLGFAMELIYLHSTLLQAANVLSILLCSRWAEGGSPMKRAAITAIPLGLLFLLYLPVAISHNASALSYVLLVLIGVFQQIAVGLHTICQYKIPYYVFRADEYGSVLSVCGIASSLLSLGVGAVISRLTVRYDFVKIAFVAFVISAALMAVVFVSTYMQKALVPIERKQIRSKAQKVAIISIFRTPLFYSLIPANIMRGFNMGLLGVLAAVAIDIGFSDTVTVALVSVQSGAALAACSYYAVFSRRISCYAQLLTGSLTMLLLPLLLIRSETVFLVVAAVVTFGKTLVDYATPAMLLRSVPMDIAGPYHAWRLVLQNAGALIATSVAVYLPVSAMLAAAMLCQIVSGVSYCVINKRYARK